MISESEISVVAPGRSVPGSALPFPTLEATLIECSSDDDGGIRAVVTPHKHQGDSSDEPDTIIECTQSQNVCELEASVRKVIPSKLLTKRPITSTPRPRKRKIVFSDSSESDLDDPEYRPGGRDDSKSKPR